MESAPSVEEQIRFLQCNLKELEHKERYYKKAIAAGTEKVNLDHKEDLGAHE